MEIREWIIYQSGSGKKVCISKIDKNNVEVYFDDDKSKIVLGNINSILKNFKDELFKLIHYPYKLGDWVYDINDEYTKSHNTPKITQITRISKEEIRPRYFVNNEDSGVNEEYFQLEYRPCFDHEIPGNNIKERKESMTYLIKFLKKRGII
jgi:hypothetical protein